MALNHLNLSVPGVQQARAFFETYFNFRRLTTTGAKGDDALVVLADETGFILTLSNFDGATEVNYPGAFHVGFMQESRERVDEIHRDLTAGGFDPKPPREFHGAWTFYLRAPGGVLVEVLHQPGADRRS